MNLYWTLVIKIILFTFSSEFGDLVVEPALLGADCAVVAVMDMLQDFLVPNVLAVSLL